jgi:hypothetical protein
MKKFTYAQLDGATARFSDLENVVDAIKDMAHGLYPDNDLPGANAQDMQDLHDGALRAARVALALAAQYKSLDSVEGA